MNCRYIKHNNEAQSTFNIIKICMLVMVVGIVNLTSSLSENENDLNNHYTYQAESILKKQ